MRRKPRATTANTAPWATPVTKRETNRSTAGSAQVVVGLLGDERAVLEPHDDAGVLQHVVVVAVGGADALVTVERLQALPDGLGVGGPCLVHDRGDDVDRVVHLRRAVAGLVAVLLDECVVPGRHDLPVAAGYV